MTHELGAGDRPPDEIDLGIAGLVDAAEIGRGGFGVVYRARQPELNRVVAVKVIGARLDRLGRERFAREAYAMGTVAGHPNIVQVFSAGVTESGRAYLMMPFVDGGSLADDLPLPWERAVAHAIKLSGALQTAHAAGVLHRDIKPSNVLLSTFGEPLLADFGIARVSGGFETSEGQISASIPYAAPEVLSGRPATVRSDVYSLAATVFCTLTGRPPFAPRSDEALVALFLRISRDGIPDLRPSGIPDGVCLVIEAALLKDPTGRTATALEFGRGLQDAQRVEGAPVTSMALAPDIVEAAGDRTTVRILGPVGTTRSAHVNGVPVESTLGTDNTPPGTWVEFEATPDPVPTEEEAANGDPGIHPTRHHRRRIAVGVAFVVAIAVAIAIIWWPRDTVGPGSPVPGTPAQALGLAKPTGLAVDHDGSLLVSDEPANRVIKVDRHGAVSTFAGNGTPGADGDGGPAGQARLSNPTGLAVEQDGAVLIVSGGTVRRVRSGLINAVAEIPSDRVDIVAVAAGPAGVIFLASMTSLYRIEQGRFGAVAHPAPFLRIRSMAGDGQGNVVVSDEVAHRVVRVSPSGEVTPVAGNGSTTEAADGSSAPASGINSPAGVALDAMGRVLFAESGEQRVRRVDLDGTLHTIAGSPKGYQDNRDSGDGGPAIQATFALGEAPLAVDAAGSLYIGDKGNHRVRQVTTDGIIHAFG